MLERTQLVLEPFSLLYLFFLAHIEIYVFMDNPVQPTAYSKVSIQHNHLNRKSITQNKKYSCKINTKLIYLAVIHCVKTVY